MAREEILEPAQQQRDVPARVGQGFAREDLVQRLLRVGFAREEDVHAALLHPPQETVAGAAGDDDFDGVEGVRRVGFPVMEDLRAFEFDAFGRGDRLARLAVEASGDAGGEAAADGKSVTFASEPSLSRGQNRSVLR